jgi:hypothetical protein
MADPLKNAAEQLSKKLGEALDAALTEAEKAMPPAPEPDPLERLRKQYGATPAPASPAAEDPEAVARRQLEELKKARKG